MYIKKERWRQLPLLSVFIVAYPTPSIKNRANHNNMTNELGPYHIFNTR
jgi:hypothetical protein